jgi:NitT/TauT family transport system substrate-binding protein
MRGAKGLVFAAFSGLSILFGTPGLAADHVKVSAFQGTFINFPVYVAKDLKIFEKHGIDAELVYGKGIQPTNMVVSGATMFGGFAVEHGIILASKGQDVRLLVLNQTLPPFTIIVRNQVPTPNVDAAYPKMLKDLKGLKIGISSPGAGTDLTIRYLLEQAGLDPQRDAQIVPVGGPSTQVAALKNGVIDATIAFEPIQTEAIFGLKIAKPILDIEGGHGPDIFREYAYNGIFTRQTTLDSNPDLVRRFVSAIVEAEQTINDPAQLDAVTKVAAQNMSGIDPANLKAYIGKYRHIFAPIATKKAIENVNQFLIVQKSITKAVPFEKLVASDFMPKHFDAH